MKKIQNPTTIEKNGHQYNVFNFDIECGGGIILPITVWDDDIARIKGLIGLYDVRLFILYFLI